MAYCYQSQAPTLSAFQIVENISFALTLKLMDIFLLASKLVFRSNLCEDLASLACDAA
jgi:hypothetical protein